MLIRSDPIHGWTMAVSSSSLHGMVHHDGFAGAFNGSSSAFAQFNNSAQPLCIARPRHVRRTTNVNGPIRACVFNARGELLIGEHRLLCTRATSNRTNAPSCRDSWEETV